MYSLVLRFWSLLCIVIALLASPTSAYTKKKPWDLSRYTACTKLVPYDQLDRDMKVTSTNCKQKTQVVEQKDFSGTSLVADPFFIATRRADRSSDWRNYLIINISYDRGKGGIINDDRGAARLKAAAFILDEGRVARNFDPSTYRFDGCQTYRAFGTSMTSCTYVEGLGLALSDDEITKLRSKIAADPMAKLRMRISGETGETFDMEFDIAELIAVLDVSTKLP
jgi:hypothetical protein